MYKYYKQHGDCKTITGHAVEESLTLDTMGINSMFSRSVTDFQVYLQLSRTVKGQA
jgi:hypothetical protein